MPLRIQIAVGDELFSVPGQLEAQSLRVRKLKTQAVFEMEASSTKLTQLGKFSATACLALGLLAGPDFAAGSEPPAIRTAIEGRATDYRRLDPGVPFWPSTCDCISVNFGFKDSSGYRPVRFRFADAADYYGQNASGGSNTLRSKLSASKMSARGPLKELADENVEPDSES